MAVLRQGRQVDHRSAAIPAAQGFSTAGSELSRPTSASQAQRSVLSRSKAPRISDKSCTTIAGSVASRTSSIARTAFHAARFQPARSAARRLYPGQPGRSGPAALSSLKRMRGLTRLISPTGPARLAFRAMNEAVARAARQRDAGQDGDPSKQRVPRWRPFQIAFILLNLSGLQDRLHPDREVVDLLFFPTGGGKID
jgi:hypothetical protein